MSTVVTKHRYLTPWEWDPAEILQMNFFQSREFSPESFVYIVTFFRLSMTKRLLVKWRHCDLNAHQLCVLISIPLNHTAMSAHLYSNWGGLFAGPPRGPDSDEGGRPEHGEERRGWFWPEPQISERSRSFLFLSYTWPTGRGRWGILGPQSPKQTDGAWYFLTYWAVACDWPGVSIY